MKMKIILDTNIIISAALSPDGNPAKIIDLITSNEDYTIYYNDEIIAEYNEVLSRPHFYISIDNQKRIINEIINTGINYKSAKSTMPMKDEDDRIFYDTALETGALLITGNKKHFPNDLFILTPSEFLSKQLN